MKTATQKDWEKAKENIKRTAQDSLGDIIIRTKRNLIQKGFTHYLYYGYPKKLE